MTLSNAIRTATSSLSSNSQQIAALSRNIAGVGDPNYVRRDTDVYTANYGTTRVETVRYVNQSLFDASVLANANSSRSDVIANGLNKLAFLQDINEFSNAPSRLLSELRQATELAAASPSDSSTLANLVETARSTANALNGSYDELLSMRANADKAIDESVGNINSLLSQLKEVNDQIVNASRVGRQELDSMDIRDQLLNQISQEIGINVVPRENDDIIVMTSTGVMLFEGEPRDITFQSTPSYGPNTTGGELRIDGVVVSGGNSSLPIRSGNLAGHFEMRDNLLVQQQNQLDEIARGMVELFSEEDQTGGGKPPLAGLFTWSGGPTVPASATLEPGIAMTIALNPLVDPTSGGNASLLRDGAINGDVDYTYNTSGSAGFSDRLFALSDGFNTARSFDVSAGLPGSQSLSAYADASLDWLNATRQSANSSKSYQNELAVRFKESLQGETAPNLDYEMSRLLEVERAYQATARLINSVDQMLQTLLEVAA